MSLTSLEDAKAAWARGYEGWTQAEIDRRVIGFGALVRGIFEDGAVAPEEFSRATSLNTKQASELFSRGNSGSAGWGIERCIAGRLLIRCRYWPGEPDVKPDALLPHP